MKTPNKITKSRDIKQLMQTAIIISHFSMKRLLFSKTTLSLVFLCLIPVIVFSLWVGGVFPQETKNLYEDKMTNRFELDEKLMDGLKSKYGGISLVRDDLNMSVEITEAFFQPIETSKEGSLNIIYLNGTTNGNVSFLNLSISFHVYGFSLPYNLSVVGPLEIGPINFTGLGEEEINYWQNWKFELENFTIPNFDISQLQGFGINIEDFTGDESPIRLGILVQAIDNSTLNENRITWNFDYEEVYIEIDETGITDYGIVGKDIKKKTIEESGYDVFNSVAPYLYFIVIVPLITILYAISVVREDIENHNIVYLISRPISKAEILLYKFKGFFISTWVLVAISMTISFIIIALSEPNTSIKIELLTNLLIISTLNILAYGALFFIFTLITSYPIILSLLYVFIWENIISTMPSVLNRLSIIYWVKALGDRMLPEIGITNVYLPLSVFESIMVLISITIIFLIVAIFLFYNKQFT